MESLNKIPNPFEKKPEGKIKKDEANDGEEEILEGEADFGLETPDDDKKEKNKQKLKDEIEKLSNSIKNSME